MLYLHLSYKGMMRVQYSQRPEGDLKFLDQELKMVVGQNVYAGNRTLHLC